MKSELGDGEAGMLCRLGRGPRSLRFMFGFDRLSLRFLVRKDLARVYFDWDAWRPMAEATAEGHLRIAEIVAEMRGTSLTPPPK